MVKRHVERSLWWSPNNLGGGGNSFANQFKGVVDTMAHSLKIKEDSYIKMFAEKEKVVKDFKGALDRIRFLEEKYLEMGASLIVSDCKIIKLEKENAFLKKKLAVVDEKLKRGKY